MLDTRRIDVEDAISVRLRKGSKRYHSLPNAETQSLSEEWEEVVGTDLGTPLTAL